MFCSVRGKILKEQFPTVEALQKKWTAAETLS